MGYQVLARKWRPQVFETVIGQVHVARALQNAVKAGRVAHAYLFSGPRGVGKTTMARVLAKALNCAEGPTPTPCNRCSACQEIGGGASVDVLEIDGASNTSVDDIRELRETVKYMPLQGKHKIYIIDEVHMLSNSAFNALLKTLEEPPPHMVFIFATTEAHKIPSTIRSRCQHFQFKRIARKDIVAQLREIVAEEKIGVGEPELYLLAKGADGSMRDALGLLDQVLAYGGPQVRAEDLLAIMGVADRQQVLSMMKAIQRKDAAEAVARVQELVEQGHELKQFCNELVQLIRDLLMLKIARDPQDLVECPAEDLEDLKKLAGASSPEELQWLFKIFVQTYEDIRNFFYPPFLLEMAVVRACRIDLSRPIDEVLEKMAGWESRLQGMPPRPVPTAAARDPKKENPGPPAGPSGGGMAETGERGLSGPGSQGGESSNQIQARNRPVVTEPVTTPDFQGSAEGLSDIWQRIIQMAKARRPYLASYLEHGVLMSGSPDEVVVGFPKTGSFFADLIQKQENIGLITSLVEECFGRRLRFRVVLHGDAALADRPVRDLHPAVKDALKILGGEIVDPGGS